VSFKNDGVDRHQPPRLTVREPEEFISATVIFIR
jgi:hypothetical protein